MKFKELENNVNLMIEFRNKELNNEFKSLFYVLQDIRSMIIMTLKKEYDLKDVNIRPKGQSIQIFHYYAHDEIEIKVIKKIKRDWKGSLYLPVEIKVDTHGYNFESFEDFIEHCNKIVEEKENKKTNSINEFKTFLEEKNITIEDFVKMTYLYDRYKYYI